MKGPQTRLLSTTQRACLVPNRACGFVELLPAADHFTLTSKELVVTFIDATRATSQAGAYAQKATHYTDNYNLFPGTGKFAGGVSAVSGQISIINA